MLTDYLKPATFLFQNCSTGGKEPNKEGKKNKEQREDEESIKRKR